MNAELLSSPPVSGELEEVQIDAVGTTTWIKFEDQDYLDYYGVFGGGDGGRSKVVTINELAFVLSRGQGYIFDINKRSLVHKTKWDDLSGVIAVPASTKFVAHDFTNLFVYSTELVWTSKRVSMDGIELETVEKETVFGKVQSYSGSEVFSLNLETFQFQCDWVCDLD